MHKSSLNRLNNLLNSDDNNDVDIDINVIIESDDSVDLINDAIEQVEDNAELNKMEEQNELQEEEAETLKAVSSILKKHGLNPGMAAILNTLLPMKAYGIILPATESLSSTTTNRTLAEQLIVAFENGYKGLTIWEGIKKTFFRMLSMLNNTFERLISFLGSMDSRIVRMGNKLEGTYSRSKNDSKNSKGEYVVKIPQLKLVNNFYNNKSPFLHLAWLENVLDFFKLEDRTADIIKIFNFVHKNSDQYQHLLTSDPEHAEAIIKEAYSKSDTSESVTDYSKILRTVFPNDELKENLGCEWEKETGYSLKIDNSFLGQIDGEEADKKMRSYYIVTTHGENIYTYTLDICKMRARLDLVRKSNKDFIKRFERDIDIDSWGMDKNSPFVKILKSKLTTLKSFIASIQKLFTRIYQVCTKICLNYLKCGRKLLAGRMIEADADIVGSDVEIG